MDQDKKKKLIPVPRIQMDIPAKTRQNIMQACSNVVATPEEVQANILVPFPECLRRLHEMGVAAQSMRDKQKQISFPSESKEDVKNISAQGEPTKDVTEIPALGGPMVGIISPISKSEECLSNVQPNKIEVTIAGNDIQPRATARLSQVIIDKMKAALLNTPRRVKLPSEKQLPKKATTFKTNRKAKRPRGPPIPQLGRPVPKRNIPASVNTTRKPRSDDMQTADKGLTNEGTEPVCNDIVVTEE
ncbi:hypothetical protein HA402_003316 [Bradysia odoriphaga]|nr:hypothetical protein HA402_003316 [Bradysia odoriphaga]